LNKPPEKDGDCVRQLKKSYLFGLVRIEHLTELRTDINPDDDGRGLFKNYLSVFILGKKVYSFTIRGFGYPGVVFQCGILDKDLIYTPSNGEKY